MRAAVCVALMCCVASTWSVAIGPGSGPGPYHFPQYRYSYGVADKFSGDNKSAHEVRDGDLVKGSYQVVQPDGVLRTVNYVSTSGGGFQAQVINKGVAWHPAGPAVRHAPGLLARVFG